MNQFRNQIIEDKDEASEQQSLKASEFDDEKRFNNPVQQLFNDRVFDITYVSKYLPFVFFLVGLGMLYITNIHILENKVRKIEKLSKEVKELSWEYKTGKAELMYKSKQTEVANVVDTLGIKVLTAPPIKILVQKNEN